MLQVLNEFSVTNQLLHCGVDQVLQHARVHARPDQGTSSIPRYQAQACPDLLEQQHLLILCFDIWQTSAVLQPSQQLALRCLI